MKRTLSLFDRLALDHLKSGYWTATHHIAAACGFHRVSGDRATTRARTLLRRLARWGLVQGKGGMGGGGVRWWMITDAGRAALEGAAA